MASLDFSPAAAPPAAASVELALEDVSLALRSASLVEDVPPELSDEPLVDFLLVEVDAAFAAACSALVFVGGVISGVLFGSGSDTVALPHALRPRPASRDSASASEERDLTAGPCVCRRWGSR